MRTHLPFLRDAVIHTFRHTRASRFAQAGHPLMKIMEWMGHRSYQTTLRYAHLCPTNLNDMLGEDEKGPPLRLVGD